MVDGTYNLAALAQGLSFAPGGAAVSQYMAYLNRLLTERDPLFEKEYLPLIQAEAVSRRPFLSVVMRTQGKRPAMLREALQSLSEQSDQDFEVILVGHKVDDLQRQLVQHICDGQPEALRSRIRFAELGEGNRTKPLNFGFSLAHGEYIAVLDDDDIVMPNWVASFREGARRAPGALLHTYVLVQDWVREVTAEGEEILRAVSAQDTMFCEKFHLMRQIRYNHCPLHGLAFPGFVFRNWGIIFDEALTTYEDWDYQMRVAALVGVEDIEVPTAVYRMWVDAENSRTVHNQEEWKRNHALIHEKLIHMPFFVPAGNEAFLSRRSMEEMSAANTQFDLTAEKSSKLYLNFGEGYSEHNTITTELITNGQLFDVNFKLPVTVHGPESVRFDLTESGMFVMQNVTCVCGKTDGTQTVLTLEQGGSNGIVLGKSILFPGEDPWVSWHVGGSQLSYIHIIGEVGQVLPAEALAVVAERLQENNRPGILRRILNKLKRLLKI